MALSISMENALAERDGLPQMALRSAEASRSIVVEKC